DLVLARDLREAWAHAVQRRLGPVLAIKWSWGMAGGFLVCLPLLAAERFSSVGAAQAIGWLYAARGVGTGIGPLLARRLGQSDREFARSIAVSFLIAAAGYTAAAFAPNLVLACLCVALAHTGGSTIWVFSTVLWQRRVEDAYRGRVHTLEFLGLTLSFVAWGFVSGLVFDVGGSVATALLVTAAGAAAAGPLWWRRQAHRRGS
ncbi:MAG: hypothetical protein O2816_08815, partial [Planctomycetota bacterium]|nr:hypothetical protein [Planctomycetota bacterium]